MRIRTFFVLAIVCLIGFGSGSAAMAGPPNARDASVVQTDDAVITQINATIDAVSAFATPSVDQVLPAISMPGQVRSNPATEDPRLEVGWPTPDLIRVEARQSLRLVPSVYRARTREGSQNVAAPKLIGPTRPLAQS